MEVILAFVKDYNIDGEYHVWDVYSEYATDEQIEKDIQDAKNAGEIEKDSEYFTERWMVSF